MSMKNASGFVGLALVLLVSAGAYAGTIGITNHSFEDDVIPRDGNTATQNADGSDDWHRFLTPTGWLLSGTENRGVASTATDSFFGASLAVTPDADANDQAVFLADSTSFYQVLTGTLQANSTYTLMVDVGDRSTDPGTGNPSIALGTGTTMGSNLLTPATSDTTAPALGEWTTWTVTYTTDASPTGLGDPLRIDLFATSAAGWFDNVRLEVVPEPATMSLLALGGIAMLRRHKK